MFKLFTAHASITNLLISNPQEVLRRSAESNIVMNGTGYEGSRRLSRLSLYNLALLLGQTNLPTELTVRKLLPGPPLGPIIIRS